MNDFFVMWSLLIISIKSIQPIAGISGLQGPPGIKGDRGQDGGKGEPVWTSPIYLYQNFYFTLKNSF